MTTLRSGSIPFLMLLVLLAPAGAQETDSRWLPWVGCWAPVGAATEEGAEPADAAEDALLCIRPVAGGVEVTELAGGAVQAREVLRADGAEHAVADDACAGWRSARFAEDGRRLYTRAEQACGDDPVQASTGIIAMVTPLEWVDVQALEVDGESVAWVQRYRAAPAARAQAAGFPELAADRGMSTRAARTAAAGTVDVDDVIEAADEVHPEAVRAWIAEGGEPFDLDASRLLRLADAGVPESVIDVMVAVSYPERFALERGAPVERIEERRAGRRPAYGGYGRRSAFFGRGYWSPLYYSPYDYGYGYGYGSPYYGGWYGPVIVAPRQDAEPDARVVRGRGYSRGRGDRDSAPPPSAGSDRRDPTPAPKPAPSGSSTPTETRRAKPRGG